MFIGFNIDRANDAMESVNEAYTEVTNEISNRFDELASSFRGEWVGPDELDFEKKLKNRLEELEREVKGLVVNTVEVFSSLATSWANFQDTNTIKGASTGTANELLKHLKMPSILLPKPIKFVDKAFDSSTNFGLANSGSTSTLRGSLQTFVDHVQRKIESLFSEIDTNAAFYGENQAAKLKLLKEKVGESIAIVATSVKDFDLAMEKLTTAYVDSDKTVGEAITEGANGLMSGINEATSSTRWSSGGSSSTPVGGGSSPSSSFTSKYF